MPSLKALIAAVALAVALAAGAGESEAQSGYSDAKLAAFIEAAVAVNRLRDHWTPKIGSAQNEADAEAMMKQANGQMSQAVERTEGITLTEYMEIVEAAERDPALSDQLNSLYRAKVGE